MLDVPWAKELICILQLARKLPEAFRQTTKESTSWEMQRKQEQSLH